MGGSGAGVQTPVLKSHGSSTQGQSEGARGGSGSGNDAGRGQGPGVGVGQPQFPPAQHQQELLRQFRHFEQQQQQQFSHYGATYPAQMQQYGYYAPAQQQQQQQQRPWQPEPANADAADLRAQVAELRAALSSRAQEAPRHGGANPGVPMRQPAPDAPSGEPAASDDGARVRDLEFEVAKIRAAAEINGSIAGARTASEGSDDVANQAAVGLLLEHHPRNRFPRSERKHRISGDQARLLKALKADSSVRQTVGHFREVCRLLDNVGLAIDDTTAAFAAGECGADALVSLLHQMYSALAAPSEKFEAGETRPKPSMLVANEERMDIMCMAKDTGKVWAIALQQDHGAALFSSNAVRTIKDTAANKELQRVEKSLLKPQKGRQTVKSDSERYTEDSESSDEAPAAPPVKAPPAKAPRTHAQKTADRVAADKRRAALKAKAS